MCENFILQALFQSAQHFHEKRKESGSGCIPLNNGSGGPKTLTLGGTKNFERFGRNFLDKYEVICYFCSKISVENMFKQIVFATFLDLRRKLGEISRQCCGSIVCFGPPGSVSGSVSHKNGSGTGSGSFHHQAKIVRKALISTVL